MRCRTPTGDRADYRHRRCGAGRPGGYERQKKQLTDNTEAFLNEQPANNVLLYGDAGTGKSTSIKALLNHYYDRGLRMIEVYKHDFKYLPEIISIIKSRNYRFIIYMDDLSFESAETEYKYLKAVIEGDLEVRPDNVLIYATSNRRHLIRESFADRQETDANDVHKNDTMAEKLSLSARFGVSIAYYKPAHQEYHDIVRTLAERQGVNLPEEELLLEADRWATRHAENPEEWHNNSWICSPVKIIRKGRRQPKSLMNGRKTLRP